MLTQQLAQIFLQQAGLISKDEDLSSDPTLPAKVGDILKSKKYWSEMPDRMKKNEYGKSKRISDS